VFVLWEQQRACSSTDRSTVRLSVFGYLELRPLIRSVHLRLSVILPGASSRRICRTHAHTMSFFLEILSVDVRMRILKARSLRLPAGVFMQGVLVLA
jgi:hypothetical protein